jgi:hypothetical protein
MSFEEAESIGSSLGEASPTDALPVLLEWADVKSGFRSILSKIRKDAPGDRMLAAVTAAGLAHCRDAESTEALRGLLARWASDAEITIRLQQALDRLEKGQDHG